MIPYQSVSLVFLLKVAESKQRFDRRILVLIDPSVTETGGTRDFPVPGRDGTKKKESRAGRDGTGQRLKLRGTGRDSSVERRDGTGFHDCSICPASPADRYFM
jgi:hypothetical protein